MVTLQNIHLFGRFLDTILASGLKRFKDIKENNDKINRADTDSFKCDLFFIHILYLPQGNVFPCSGPIVSEIG